MLLKNHWKEILFGFSFFIITYLLKKHYLKGLVICNSGSAWGLINNQFVLITGSFILIAVTLFFYLSAEEKIKRLGWLFLALAGASNLWERIEKGCVLDYWSPVSWWPAFNLADIFIVLGVFLILYNSWKEKRIISKL